ncbi:2-C-methyl-D-erythritol 2,4-cyclodiphosphate synthase [Thermostichus sp. OS-CIW-21]
MVDKGLDGFPKGAGKVRIGQGYDIHRLVEGRPLILGGIRIPYEKGLLGHSDADVLTHAIMDALLGAAALRDIGYYFPPEEERWKGADSILLLQQVVQLVSQEGWRIVNVDSVVVAEQPKLKPHIPAMQARLAEAMQISPKQVGVKATTNEKLGPIGQGEAIAAFAVALLLEQRGQASSDLPIRI